MFLKLCSIERTRLTRRALPWIILAACGLYTWLSLHNYYTLNRTQLQSGGLKMPGLSFDLATSLDQLTLISLPLLVILAANLVGNDYSQRTNRHWLMRAPRHTGLLAKFAVLAVFALALHVFILLLSGGTGWYYKTYQYDSFSLANLNGPAILAAPLYMTLASLPYLALILLFTIATRSTFAGALLGLGYTQFIELLVTSVFHGSVWMAWNTHNLATSLTYLLNGIGNRVVELPNYYAQPIPAMAGLLGYTVIFLTAALWLYRRQDVGG